MGEIFGLWTGRSELTFFVPGLLRVCVCVCVCPPDLVEDGYVFESSSPLVFSLDCARPWTVGLLPTVLKD